MHEDVAHGSVNGDLLDSYSRTGRPVCRVYEPQAIAVVLGAGGKVERDCAADRLNEDGIPVYRRRGGGGTVLLSPGQIVVALVTEVGSPFHNREYATRMNDVIIHVLAMHGVQQVEHAGICDLAIRNRKILGSSIYRRRCVFFYQASLLVDVDLSLFTRYLSEPGRAPDYRAGRSHERFCTTIRREMSGVSPAALTRSLQDAFALLLSRRERTDLDGRLA